MNQPSRDDQRRLVFVLARENEIINLLNLSFDAEWVAVPVLAGVPPDAIVRSVDYDPCRMCWRVKVWHQSFRSVPDFELIPIIEGAVHLMKLERKDPGI